MFHTEGFDPALARAVLNDLTGGDHTMLYTPVLSLYRRKGP